MLMRLKFFLGLGFIVYGCQSALPRIFLNACSVPSTVLGFAKMDKRYKTPYIPISWSL